MKTKLTPAEYDALPEGFQAEYTQSGDDWLINIESTDGRTLEDSTNLRNGLAAERAALKAAKSKLKMFGDLDPESARNAMQTLADLGDDPEGASKAALEGLKAELGRKHASELESHTKINDGLTSQLRKVLQTERATSALSAVKGNVKLLLPHVVSQLGMIQDEAGEFAVRVLNADGSERVSMKSGDTGPMGIEELVGIMREDTTFQMGFEGTDASGAGSKNTERRRDSGSVLRISSTDQDSIDANWQKIADGDAIVVE